MERFQKDKKTIKYNKKAIMTVFELIAKLSHYNPNSKVIVDVDKNGDIYLKIDENKIQHKSEIVIQFNLTKEIMEEQIKEI